MYFCSLATIVGQDGTPSHPLSEGTPKAVHQDYPAVYEQVTAVYNLLDTLAFALLTGWFTSHIYKLLGFKTLYQDLLSETSPNKPDEISYLKVHKREIFYGSDFEIFTFS